MNNLWFLLAIGAYFLLAFNGVADKFLLTKAVKSPLVYAFYAGISTPLTFLLWALGLFGNLIHWHFLQAEFTVQFLSMPNTLVAILGGACFPLALYFSYKAYQQTSVSRIMPIQGGMVPVFTLILAYLVLGERLTGLQTGAFLLLVFGAMLISFRKERGQWHAKALGNALISSFLFALSLTLQKFVFFHVNFASGLVWTRLGFFLVALSFLIPASVRKQIFSVPKDTSTGNKFVYLGARISGFLSGFLQNYAIKLGSVTLVNSLQGTQFAFLLILTSLLSIKFPKVLREKVNSQTLSQKIIAIIFISVGLALIAV